MHPLVKLLLDLGPLMAFFMAYRFGGAAQNERILLATGVLIAATLLSLLATYMMQKKLAVMPLVSAVAVTLFGGLTLFLQNDIFIKMKPTFVNMLFAVLLLGGVYARKPLLKYVLGEALSISDEGWLKLSLRWGIFFIFLAALNETIWRHFSMDFWVNFKVFGMFALTMLFTLCQVPFIKTHWQEPPHDG